MEEIGNYHWVLTDIGAIVRYIKALMVYIQQQLHVIMDQKLLHPAKQKPGILRKIHLLNLRNLAVLQKIERILFYVKKIHY